MINHIIKMKKEQEGANGFSNHVDANPWDPVVYFISAMSIIGYQRPDTSRYGFGVSVKVRNSKMVDEYVCQQQRRFWGAGYCGVGSTFVLKGVTTL